MVHIFASAESASSRPTSRPGECAHSASTGLAATSITQPGSEGSGPHAATAADAQTSGADSRLRWAALDSEHERLVDSTHPLLRDLAGE